MAFWSQTVITSIKFGCDPNLGCKFIRNQWFWPPVTPDDLHKTLTLFGTKWWISTRSLDSIRLMVTKDSKSKIFPLLNSNDLKRPCFQNLWTPWKNHYLRNIMTTFQEHKMLSERGDILLRFSHNSQYWPLNDLDLHFLLVTSYPTPNVHCIQVPSKCQKMNVWELVKKCWQAWYIESYGGWLQ